MKSQPTNTCDTGREACILGKKASRIDRCLPRGSSDSLCGGSNIGVGQWRKNLILIDGWKCLLGGQTVQAEAQRWKSDLVWLDCKVSKRTDGRGHWKGQVTWEWVVRVSGRRGGGVWIWWAGGVMWNKDNHCVGVRGLNGPSCEMSVQGQRIHRLREYMVQLCWEEKARIRTVWTVFILSGETAVAANRLVQIEN
jgi:hypothetical protein